MTEKFDQGYAAQFLGKNAEIVASWEKSSDPIRAALAVLLKQTAGDVNCLG